MSWVFRILDRGCCKPLKKEANEENTECNTGKVLQSELNKLYTGDQIKGYGAYA
jgi:hypothetical protein